jgi:hypothetical protein
LVIFDIRGLDSQLKFLSPTWGMSWWSVFSFMFCCRNTKTREFALLENNKRVERSLEKLNESASDDRDKLCFHRTNSRTRWRLVIDGVVHFHDDQSIFMDKARDITLVVAYD